MGVSTFNYTGRKDFLRTGGDNPEVEIKIYDTDNGIKFEPFFNFDKKRDFPGDSKIRIQLYSTSGDNFVSTPFDFEDPAELARIAIQCYNIPIHGVKNEDRTILN